MLNLEDLNKETTGQAAAAVQRAVELSETARLSGMIAAEEKKMDDAYAQIGRRTVALHGNSLDRELVGLVEMIRDAEGRARAYRAQLNELKGVPAARKPEEAPKPQPVPVPPVQPVEKKAPEAPKPPVQPAPAPEQKAPEAPKPPVQPAPAPEQKAPEAPKPQPAPAPSAPPQPVRAEQPPRAPEQPRPPMPPTPSRPSAPSANEAAGATVPLTPPSSAPSSAPAKPAQSGDKICPFCGAKIPGYSAFCTECGKRL